MPGPEDGSCQLFVDDCSKKYSPQELFGMVIGEDDNGCPYVKTNGPTAQQVVDLTAAINALTAAL